MSQLKPIHIDLLDAAATIFSTSLAKHNLALDDFNVRIELRGDTAETRSATFYFHNVEVAHVTAVAVWFMAYSISTAGRDHQCLSEWESLMEAVHTFATHAAVSRGN